MFALIITPSQMRSCSALIAFSTVPSSWRHLIGSPSALSRMGTATADSLTFPSDCMGAALLPGAGGCGLAQKLALDLIWNILPQQNMRTGLCSATTLSTTPTVGSPSRLWPTTPGLVPSADSQAISKGGGHH